MSGAAPGDPVLVADIGATHARFALAAAGPTVTDVQVMRCGDHAGLAEAAQAYLEGLARAGRAQRPRRAILAIAGPVTSAVMSVHDRPPSSVRAVTCSS